MIGFIVPVEGNEDEFIVGADNRLVVIKWNGVSKTAAVIRNYAEVDQNIKSTRFNDGKVDPRGRIYSGTMRSEKHGDIRETRLGTLYRFDGGISIALRKNVNISNGLAWNEATNKFYYIDSGDHDVKEYDWNPSTGEISNSKVVLELENKECGFDGMTIDENGFLYIATFGEGVVKKFDPRARQVVHEIKIPNAMQITSVAFGGPNLDELFVTTAAITGFPGPNGRLFKVTGLGSKGTQMYEAKIL